MQSNTLCQLLWLRSQHCKRTICFLQRYTIVLVSGRGSGDPASVVCTPYVHEIYTITSNSAEVSQPDATIRFKGNIRRMSIQWVQKTRRRTYLITSNHPFLTQPSPFRLNTIKPLSNPTDPDTPTPTAPMDNHIALFVTMHPASKPAQSTLLTNLRHGARSYYRLPSSRCTAWSYLTPLHSRPKEEDAELLIAGLEIYTSKSALQDQLNDTTFFQPFEELVAEEKLCRKEGSMLAWYLAAGFLTRSSQRELKGGGGVVIVEVRRLSCVGRVERDDVVRGLSEFAGWCRGSDAGALTFAMFTRKKDEREVLVYVRYSDEVSMGRLTERPEWVNFW